MPITDPLLLRQWHPLRNGDLSPGAVSPGSHKKVWWRCSEGHVWRAVIFTRARGNFCGCPVCAGRVKRRTKEFAYAAYTGGRVNNKEEKRL